MKGKQSRNAAMGEGEAAGGEFKRNVWVKEQRGAPGSGASR